MIRKTTQGFTIIELLIAFAIGSLLAGILFQTFFQSNRFVQVIDDVIATNTSAITVLNQLEKDITGIYAPIIFPEKDNKQKSNEPKKEDPTKTDNKKDVKEQKSKKESESKEKKPKKKPLTKIFYATEQNEILAMLSFITTNSLSTYINTATGRMRPRFVRVLYKLEQEPATDDEKSVPTYRLLRKESTELDFERSQKDTSTFWYELATGIQELYAEYITVQENKDGQMSEESVTNWDIKENQNKNDEKKPDKEPDKKKIPDFVTLTLSFASKHNTTVFESTIAINSQPYTLQKQQASQKATDKKSDDKKGKESTDAKKTSEKTNATTTKTKKNSSKVSSNTVVTVKQSEKK